MSVGEVGDGTSVGPFSIVAEGAVVGRDCRIGPHVVIEAGARVGDRVTIHSGTQLWAGVTIEDDVFVGPNVSFCNDRLPRAGRAADAEPTVVRSGASVGAGAAILPGLEIGPGAMVGAGAVVARTVPRDAVVVGNPARIVSYAGADRHQSWIEQAEGGSQAAETGVRGVTLHRFAVVRDLRGSLIAGEVGRELPFAPQRYFYVFDVPGSDVRGEHAHRTCHQFLIPIHGELHVVADDGARRQEFVLTGKETGLYLPPMTWALQYRYSPESVLLVLASHAYDPDDYIRDYGDFLREARERAAG